MPRLTPLSTLRTMLKAELGKSLTIGTADDTILNQLLATKQQWLAGEYDWSFLEDRFDIVCASGSRYLTFPSTDVVGTVTAMNLERPYLAEVFYNNRWSELAYGIGSAEFNYLNSDQAGIKQDPIQRWRWASQTKFEIWPVNSTAQMIRFTGQRVLAALVADNDLADLDDLLIVYGVAAEQLARAKQKDATLKQQLFTERLTRLRASYPGRPKGLVFGVADESFDQNRRISPIAVHGN